MVRKLYFRTSSCHLVSEPIKIFYDNCQLYFKNTKRSDGSKMKCIVFGDKVIDGLIMSEHIGFEAIKLIY